MDAFQANPPKLLDRVRQAIRLRHYSRRTEQAYVGWIRRFIVFHGKRHPTELGEREVTAFVSDLAARGVSASTQNQALGAVLFLFEVVLGATGMDEGYCPGSAAHPSARGSLEGGSVVAAVAAAWPGLADGVAPVRCWFEASGVCRARVKDINFDRARADNQGRQGWEDRVTMLPQAMTNDLREHLGRVQAQHV